MHGIITIAVFFEKREAADRIFAGIDLIKEKNALDLVYKRNLNRQSHKWLNF
tara:strand:+ start:850 stop:1005 length:156 start_codon:yes stop_codon:yes gene_type:complete